MSLNLRFPDTPGAKDISILTTVWSKSYVLCGRILERLRKGCGEETLSFKNILM